MRRLTLLLSLAALLGVLSLGAQAQLISIAGETDMMDISLRDAEISEVLIALFNTTNGKYQLQIGNGVVGRIPRLQLVQTPFEKALDAILGTEYSYTKQQLRDGAFLYKISGRQGAAPSPTTPRTGVGAPTFAPPSASVTTPPATKPTDEFPVLTFPTRTTPGAGTPGSPTTGSPSTGAPASTESFVKLIRLKNLDVESLCDALGAESMPWIAGIGEEGSGTGSSRGSSRGGRSSRNNNDYNDNNNNDRYNNNNNNNNNNNDNNRTRRTRDNNDNNRAL